ncbi:MAG: hypothetical protein ACLTTR_05170 [Clostridia bacterium]|jgi:hypothetical protein|nr:hypothetical protein [Clostridium sp.]
MRNARLNFVDETFGEEVECLIIWDDEEFITITIQNESIYIKKYKDIKEFIKESITNKSELDFLRNLVVEQEKDLEKLEDKLKWKIKQEKH